MLPPFARAGWPCLAALLSACPSPSSLPEIEWEGEHVLIASDHPEQICGGSREYLDRRAGQILEKLGSEPVEIEYYFLEDVADYCALPGVAGCATTGLVYSERIPHLHEIVHARVSSRMPTVLEEGLATYFGDPYPISTMAPRERLAELLHSEVEMLNDSADYERAAHFMAFLSEQYGLESLLELDKMLDAESSAEEISLAFEAVFGLDTDAMLDEYGDYPDCAGNVDVSTACTGDPVEFGVANQTLERRLDCDAEDVNGPHVGMMFIEELIEIEPSVSGTRLLTLTGDGASKGGKAVIRRCGPCTEYGVGTVINAVAHVPDEELPAGRYIVRLYLPLEAGPATLGVYIGG